MVGVNHMMVSTPETPFGGVKGRAMVRRAASKASTPISTRNLSRKPDHDGLGKTTRNGWSEMALCHFALREKSGASASYHDGVTGRRRSRAFILNAICLALAAKERTSTSGSCRPGRPILHESVDGHFGRHARLCCGSWRACRGGCDRDPCVRCHAERAATRAKPAAERKRDAGAAEHAEEASDARSQGTPRTFRTTRGRLARGGTAHRIPGASPQSLHGASTAADRGGARAPLGVSATQTSRKGFSATPSDRLCALPSKNLTRKSDPNTTPIVGELFRIALAALRHFDDALGDNLLGGALIARRRQLAAGLFDFQPGRLEHRNQRVNRFRIKGRLGEQGNY